MGNSGRRRRRRGGLSQGGGLSPGDGLSQGDGFSQGGGPDGARAGASASSSGGKRGPEQLKAPVFDYADEEGNVLSLRGSLPAKARAEYARTLAGVGARPAATPEDRWQRAVELLFERLAVRWEIAGAPIESQRELLQRYRWASGQERAFVARSLREHCAEHFPDIQAP